MNYYERHIGDYLKDTAHLSLLEHGVYTRLLDVYYTREGALPDDQVARLVGARSKDEKEALQAVLAEFFTSTPEGWVQDRCDREIARYQDKQNKAKRSANARWNAQPSQSDGNANASTVAMRTHSDGNAPNPQSPDTSNHKHPPTPKGVRFPEFWEAWPQSSRKVARAECEKRWKARGLDADADAILAHVAAMKPTKSWQEGYEPAPLTYLNQRRWEDGGSDAPAGEQRQFV